MDKTQRRKAKVKRCFDLIGAGIALLILAPLIIAFSLLVRLKLGHPVLFRQHRPGLHGRPFLMCKFRTMTNAISADGKLLPDNQRLTKFGRFLRSSSIDELPELLNVLRGEMSLVGPRPLLVEYLDHYTETEARRHEVKPGITGWAQVNGRNLLSWEDKFALDVWYVDNQNLALDIRILWMTFWKVVQRDGISADSHATMPKFERFSKSETP